MKPDDLCRACRRRLPLVRRAPGGLCHDCAAVIVRELLGNVEPVVAAVLYDNGLVACAKLAGGPTPFEATKKC